MECNYINNELTAKEHYCIERMVGDFTPSAYRENLLTSMLLNEFHRFLNTRKDIASEKYSLKFSFNEDQMRTEEYISSFKRGDGQYVYNGDFVERETIKEDIKKYPITARLDIIIEKVEDK